MEEIKRCMLDIKHIMDHTVGVIDANGIIIASTDSALEGSEDLSIRAVQKSQDAVSFNSERTYLNYYTGDKLQFTLFIQLLEPCAKIYIELVAQCLKVALKDRDTDNERAAFLKNILLENELPGDIPLKAREFKMPYSMDRVVFLVRVPRSESSESLYILQNMFPESETQHTFAMDEETIVMVMKVEDEYSEFVEAKSKTIMDNLNAESMTRVKIGIGMPATKLRDIAKSYRDAMLALRVGGIFEKDKYVMRYDKLGLGRLIYQLPPTLCNMFLSEVFADGAYELLDQETIHTISKFFENNLNGSETSRKLFVHRNTLVYRLDKVQKITGLDLRSFDDAVLFKLAAMVRTYLEKQDNSINSTNTVW